MTSLDLINLILETQQILKKTQTNLNILELTPIDDLTEIYCDLNDELFEIYWESFMERKITNHKILLNLALIAYELKHPLAICNIGAYYQIILRDFDTAFKYFKEGKELSDPSCTRNYFSLIKKWYFSNDTNLTQKISKTDIDELFEYYLALCKNNNDDGYAGYLNDLGALYFKEYDNLEKAEECFEKASKLGSKEAKNNYGMLKLNSALKHKENNELEKMFEDLDISEQMDNEEALSHAINYVTSLISTKNENSVNNQKYLYYLGIYYHLLKNNKKSEKFLLKGYKINKNNDDGKRCINMYTEFKFINACEYAKNNKFDMMIKEYLAAIYYKNTKAMNNLGLYYKNVDMNLCKKYLKMAIELGNKDAEYNYNVITGRLMWTQCGTNNFGFF